MKREGAKEERDKQCEKDPTLPVVCKRGHEQGMQGAQRVWEEDLNVRKDSSLLPGKDKVTGHLNFSH